MNNIIQAYQQFRSNPMQMLMQKYNIPQGIDTSNPNAILQHLLNTGQVSQAQVNSLQGMRNNPMIQQLMNKK
jgi:glycyl-tRNA synthetase alpha subunit